MRELLKFIIVLAVVCGASLKTQATIVEFPMTLEEIIEGDNRFEYGDKIFSDFDMKVISSTPGYDPDKSSITVEPVEFNGVLGLVFQSAWGVTDGEYLDVQLDFKVSVAGWSERSIIGVDNNMLNSTAAGEQVVGQNSQATISESVFSNEPLSPHPNNIAKLDTFDLADPGIDQLHDHASFAPIKEIYVTKDIYLYASSDELGDYGVANLSQFTQWFHQTPVPEPMTMVMLGMGGLLVARKKRNR